MMMMTTFLALFACKKIVDGCTDKSATNYNPDATNDNSSCYYIEIGMVYQGGIIGYILQQGDPGFDANAYHGLIVGPLTYSNPPWGCASTGVGGTLTTVGSGAANTNAIVAGCTQSGTAARYCADLVYSGYSDWYLPSKEELNKLFANRVAITYFLGDYYWSSSESDANHAWAQNFTSGILYSFKKDSTARVRAVRSF